MSARDRIARATFDHWFTIAAATGHGALASRRADDPPEYEELRDEVLRFLILDRWVRGEAAELGVEVSAEEPEADVQKAPQGVVSDRGGLRPV